MDRVIAGIRSLACILAVLTFISLCSGCFVTNCPPGGKRGLPDSTYATRQCMSCMGSGTCVGENICCGINIGCHIGTKESKVCNKENDSRTPCQVPGKTCGPEEQGNCVANGICCTSDACALDNVCKQRSLTQQQRKDELVELLKRVLESRRIAINRRD